VLEGETPFQRLENADTRANAVRFVRHVHEAIVEGKLLPPSHAQEDGALREQRASPGGLGRLPPSSRQSPRTFQDQGTIVNPKRYRVARVRDDLWVYATVQFETPEGVGDFAWLSEPDPDQQARWQEQLAAALLQEADARRPGKMSG